MPSYYQNLARRASINSAHQRVLELTLNILHEALTERGLTISVNLLEELTQKMNGGVSLQIMAGINQELQTNPVLTLVERKILLLALITAEETMMTHLE